MAKWEVMEGIVREVVIFQVPWVVIFKRFTNKKTRLQICPLYIFGNKPPQMLPKDLNIGFQGLALIPGKNIGFLGFAFCIQVQVPATLFFRSRSKKRSKS